jgi:DNA-binding NarL/FixJ family response regulator
VRVAVADDSALFREGLARLLSDAGAEVTVQAKTGDELLARIAAAPPDVVVLDIRMPPTFTDEGLATAEAVRDRHPGVAVLVLSTYAESAYAVRLLEHGAAGVGYLLKDRVDSTRTLVDSLARLQAGESVIDPDIVTRLLTRRGRSALDDLTPREKLVLSLMAEGRSTIGIGTELGVSVKTVETQIASIFNRLDLPATVDTNRRVLAVLTWLREQPRTPG